MGISKAYVIRLLWYWPATRIILKNKIILKKQDHSLKTRTQVPLCAHTHLNRGSCCLSGIQEKMVLLKVSRRNISEYVCVQHSVLFGLESRCGNVHSVAFQSLEEKPFTETSLNAQYYLSWRSGSYTLGKSPLLIS